MIVGLVLTASFHWVLARRYNHFLEFAPLDLVVEAADQQKESLADAEKRAKTENALEAQRHTEEAPQDREDQGDAPLEEEHEFLQCVIDEYLQRKHISNLYQSRILATCTICLACG